MCGPSRSGRAASKCFLTLGVPDPVGTPHHSPQAACANTGLSIIIQGRVFGQRVQLPHRTRGTCLLRRDCGGVRKACPATICPRGCAKGLRRASLGSYQLQTFICLRAARPSSGGAAANPSPAAAPPPAWPAGKPLAVVVGTASRRRGVTAAAPSRFFTTREQWWDTELCLCRAWAPHPGKGRGSSRPSCFPPCRVARKSVMLPRCQQK